MRGWTVRKIDIPWANKDSKGAGAVMTVVLLSSPHLLRQVTGV